jgi:hypothetical protein
MANQKRNILNFMLLRLYFNSWRGDGTEYSPLNSWNMIQGQVMYCPTKNTRWKPCLLKMVSNWKNVQKMSRYVCHLWSRCLQVKNVVLGTHYWYISRYEDAWRRVGWGFAIPIPCFARKNRSKPYLSKMSQVSKCYHLHFVTHLIVKAWIGTELNIYKVENNDSPCLTLHDLLLSACAPSLTLRRRPCYEKRDKTHMD